MALEFIQQAASQSTVDQEKTIIKIVGVGGGGCNAVQQMYEWGIAGVDYVVCNTDNQVLKNSTVPNKLRLGATTTEGLGSGGSPDKGQQAALESVDDIRKMFSDGTKMAFITAGMGGGTGTGAAPVIASIAREMGILTVGIVTTPFAHEGEIKSKIARAGIETLSKCVDSLIIINNQTLLMVCPKDMPLYAAFGEADKVLYKSAKGIAEMITLSGSINIDFADVRSIMADSKNALMNQAKASGENRAIIAVQEALNSPLLENVDIYGAKGLLVNITCSKDSFSIEEYQAIGSYIENAVGGTHANIKIGHSYVEDQGKELGITIVVTGFSSSQDSKRATKPTSNVHVINEVDPKTIPSFTPKQESKVALEQPYEVPAQPIPPTGQNSETRITRHHITEEEIISPHRQQYKHVPNYISPEERLARLRPTDYEYSNPYVSKQLEETPAYLRRNVDLAPAQRGRGLSKNSVGLSSHGRASIQPHNAFIDDQVD